MENSIEVSQKIRSRTTTQPSNSISGYVSRGNEIIISRDISILIFITALFTIANVQKYPKCLLTDEWVKNVVYTHHGILFSLKKGNPIICNNMNELGGYFVK